ncbi:Universal stress protein family protein [compost metagenome]
MHVVHCEPDVGGDVKSFIGKADIDAWHHEESGKAMKSVVNILREGNVGFECHELVGFTPEKIIEYAKQADASAIVIGSHHHSPLLNAIRGSVSGRILAHSPCPVLLV